MSGLSEYLLSLFCAVIVCTFVKMLLPQAFGSGKLLHLIAGVFLTITLVKPLLTIDFTDFDWKRYELDAEEFSIDGTMQANTELEAIITDKLCAYILREAEKLSASIEVTIQLKGDNPPIVDIIEIAGKTSPYKKQALVQYIMQNLGVSMEQIKWTS